MVRLFLYNLLQLSSCHGKIFATAVVNNISTLIKTVRILLFRQKVEVKLEITMGSGSSSDPNTALELLRAAVRSRHFGNLTVNPDAFTAWLKS